MKRPAETAGGLGSVGIAVAYMAGVRDPETLTYVGVVAGFLPALVTALKDGGGVVGWVREVLLGRGG